MSIFDLIAKKTINVRKWLAIAMLLSISTTIMTYYALTTLNSINGWPRFYETVPTQAWLMAKLGMENWLLLRIMIYSVISLLIIKYPMKLYERNELFRYGTNMSVGVILAGMTINFINDFATICVIQ